MLGVHSFRITVAALCAVLALASCGKRETARAMQTPSATDVDCMARAMYFESNRSSRDGMIAVGSVVMNRVASDAFPNTVCGVVGQKNQFAPGVMTKQMNLATAPLIMGAARAVLKGERHPSISKARFFHAAWYDANFNNMHYVATTGGNAFYEKRRAEKVTSPNPVPATEGLTSQ